MPTPTRTINGETREWTGTAWVPQAAPQADAGVPMHHPGASETPGDAFTSELERTAGEAGAGLLHSPIDMVKGAVHTVVHPLDTLLGLAHTVAHPLDAVKALGDDPRAGGSLLGQMLLAQALPDAAGAVRDNAGPAITTVGKGLERGGSAVLDQGRIPLGMTAAGTAAAGHPIAAAAEVGIPLAAKYGGRGLQALGDFLTPAEKPALDTLKTAGQPDIVLSGVKLSPQAVQRIIDATNMRDVDGFSHTMAGRLAGIPGAGQVKVTDVPTGEYALPDTDPFPHASPASEPVEGTGGESVLSSPSLDGLRQATKPDLYDLATADKGPAPAGEPWYGENGEVIGHTTDSADHSTGMRPVSPLDGLRSAAGTDRTVTASAPDSPAGQLMARRLNHLDEETPYRMPTEVPPEPVRPDAAAQLEIVKRALNRRGVGDASAIKTP